jgi:hypothetical protein
MGSSRSLSSPSTTLSKTDRWRGQCGKIGSLRASDAEGTKIISVLGALPSAWKVAARVVRTAKQGREEGERREREGRERREGGDG